MANTKTIRESATQRVYRTPKGSAVSCALQYQAEYDPYDGQQAGWYGWCGLVDEQSDYVLGPYETGDEVFAAYERRNKSHRRMAKVTLHRGFIGPDNRMHGKGPEFTPIDCN